MLNSVFQQKYWIKISKKMLNSKVFQRERRNIFWEEMLLAGWTQLWGNFWLFVLVFIFVFVFYSFFYLYLHFFWLVEHLRGETAPGRDLGQSKPSVSFSWGDYWKSTLLLWLCICICVWFVHLWPISDGSSLVGMLKQYKALFQLHISTEIIFTLFLHNLLWWSQYTEITFTLFLLNLLWWSQYTTHNPNG